MGCQGDRYRLGEAQRMRLVDLHFGIAHLRIHHQIEDFLGQPFEQGETVVLDMLNDRLGDGAVVQRLFDVVPRTASAAG